MKTKGWLGDRGRSRIVLDRGKEGITPGRESVASRNDVIREVGRIHSSDDVGASEGLVTAGRIKRRQRSVFDQAFFKRLM